MPEIMEKLDVRFAMQMAGHLEERQVRGCDVGLLQNHVCLSECFSNAQRFRMRAGGVAHKSIRACD